MHTGKLVFSQLMEFLPWRRFDTCVRRYHGDRKIKSYPCSEHWRVMAFAQLTYRESLRDIETFYGTNQNAVKTQIWIAVSVYLLVAIAKRRLDLPQSLYTILQILSVSIFEKTPLAKLFSQSDYNTQNTPCPNQLLLFD